MGRVLAGAAGLAAAAVFNTYRAVNAERARLPAGKFLRVDGVNLHYIERGEGPVVVLIHGNVVTAEDYVWSGVANWVAARRRVIAFDRPGFGFSDRPRGISWTAARQAALLRRALERLGVGRCIVVGHSWGALVALELALDWPDAVEGLVLMGGYYRRSARLDVPPVAPAALPVIGDVLRYTVSPIIGAALLPLTLKGMFAPRPVPERFARDFPHGFPVRPWQIRAEAEDAATMVPGAVALRGRYGEIRMPVTIMAGTEDRVVDYQHHALWLHGQIQHSVIRLVSGAGHMVHYAAPDQVAAAIEGVAERGRMADREPHSLVPEG